MTLSGPVCALELLTEILVTDESYELLVHAGELALLAARPLEAVDYYERAIALNPGRLEAYEGQFGLLTKARFHNPLEDLYRCQGATSLQLDAKVWRDFQALPPKKQEDCELEMARYLLWRCQLRLWHDDLDSVAAFIYKRLFDDAGRFLGWKVGMNLTYAQIVYRQSCRLADGGGNVDDACARLAAAIGQHGITREWLRYLMSQNVLDPADAHDYGEALGELEVDCHDLKRRLGCP